MDHDPAPGQGPGREGLTGFFTTMRTAFPDLRTAVETAVGADDTLAVRYRLEGTHRGEFIGMAPTGKWFSIAAVQISRFGADRKVVERWGSSDELGMLQQLGLVELPG